MSSAGSRPARMEWADSIRTPTRSGRRSGSTSAMKWPAVGRYVWSIGSFGFISPRMRMFWSCSSIALTASRMRPTAVDGVLGLADVGPLARQPEDDVPAAELRAMSMAPFRAFDGVLAVRRLVGRVAAVDRVGVLPQPRGDELAEQALAVEHLLDLGDARSSSAGRSRSAGTTSSSWNWTPSKPSFLYSRILAASCTSLRTGGPNGIAAGGDVPGAEREAIAGGQDGTPGYGDA